MPKAALILASVLLVTACADNPAGVQPRRTRPGQPSLDSGPLGGSGNRNDTPGTTTAAPTTFGTAGSAQVAGGPLGGSGN